MENCIGTVPIHLKMTLTIKEAAAYSNIGCSATRFLRNSDRIIEKK